MLKGGTYMQELMIKPTIMSYTTCREFADDFHIGKGDLIITNQYIYDPNFRDLHLACEILFQEKYGTGEPSDEMAEAIYQDMPKNVKRIIAIGGGTVIDLSKIFALKNVSPVLDLYDGKITPIKDKELVIVPTTCGTGSEVTNVAVLALVSRHTKKGLAVEQLYGDQAVLIPELLKTLPFNVFATSSIDALVHAVESALSPKANETTRMFSYKAIEKILNGFIRIREQGREARIPLMKNFLFASNYAGVAFGNAGCAAVHAMSYPLGAKYHVAHGESNYAMFTGVMNRYMSIKSDGEIAVMNQFFSKILGCKGENVYGELERLLNVILPKKALHEYGVTETDLKEFADSVMANQGRLMANNFVVLSEDDVIEIYKNLF